MGPPRPVAGLMFWRSSTAGQSTTPPPSSYAYLDDVYHRWQCRLIVRAGCVPEARGRDSRSGSVGWTYKPAPPATNNVDLLPFSQYVTTPTPSWIFVRRRYSRLPQTSLDA